MIVCLKKAVLCGMRASCGVPDGRCGHVRVRVRCLRWRSWRFLGWRSGCCVSGGWLAVRYDISGLGATLLWWRSGAPGRVCAADPAVARCRWWCRGCDDRRRRQGGGRGWERGGLRRGGTHVAGIFTQIECHRLGGLDQCRDGSGIGQGVLETEQRGDRAHDAEGEQETLGPPSPGDAVVIIDSGVEPDGRRRRFLGHDVSLNARHQ